MALFGFSSSFSCADYPFGSRMAEVFLCCYSPSASVLVICPLTWPVHLPIDLLPCYLSFNLDCASASESSTSMSSFLPLSLLSTVEYVHVLFLFLSSSGPEPLPRSLHLMLATSSHSQHDLGLWYTGTVLRSSYETRCLAHL